MRKIGTFLAITALAMIAGSAVGGNRNQSDERSSSRGATVAKRSENVTQKAAPVITQLIAIERDSIGATEMPVSPAELTTNVSSPSAGEQIKWQVIASGGGQGSSANFAVSGTVGQTAVGSATSDNYKVSQGYWQNFASGCCVKEGDFNHNGSTNVVDVTAYVAFLFQSGAIYGCKEEADVDENNSVNIVDLTKVVAFLFSGGVIGTCL